MTEKFCPCGSKSSYEHCCQKFHNGMNCTTTEQLLRARFTAFAKHNTNFLIDTHHPYFVTPQLISDLEDKSFIPSDLTIIDIQNGQAKDTGGHITYSFNYLSSSGKETFTTTSLYSKIGDQWFYEQDN